MSVARTALRFAVINALAADPVIAAACPDRVFDSEMGQYIPEPAPSIVVYTEDDYGDAWSANNGGPPFDQTVDLMFEISICATVQDGDETNVFYAATTRELETALDLLEQRAVDAATIGDSAQSVLVRQVTRRCTRKRSVRYASEDTSAKLARRLVTLTMSVKGDDLDVLGTGPFAALPEPLRTVAAGLDPASSAYAICVDLAGKLSGDYPTYPTFTGADLTILARKAIDSTTPPLARTDPNNTTPILVEIDIL